MSDDPRADELRRLFGRALSSGPTTRWNRSHETPSSQGQKGGPARDGRADYQSIKSDLQARLLDTLRDRELLDADEIRIGSVVDEFVQSVLREDLALNQGERERLADELREETLGVGPLAPLMADPAVSDILVNGPAQIFVERFGRLEEVDVRFRDAEHVVRVIERIAARIGRRIDATHPMLDARLPDGSRVNATIPPVTIDGPTISIRRFGRQRLRRRDLVRLGSMSEAMLQFLEISVVAKQNVLISGGTGAGKSTLLGALAEVIPGEERIVTIEDTAELILDQRHVVRMETRPANVEGSGRITARELVINSLRMRPDRIIVGEVRGGEALDMLQALNTGHEGGLSTIHANSPRDALSRLETMVLMAGLDLPSRAIREQIVSAIHLLVHVRRFEDGVRRIASVAEIAGLEGTTPLLNDIFRFERTGYERGRVLGRYHATGTVPRIADELRKRGQDVSFELFRASGGSSD
ncbi:MAG: CpaF family protein [Planctomycetota bacterium]